MSSAARWSRKQTSNSKGSNKRSGTFSQHQPMINGEWHTHTLIMPPLIATSLSFLKFRAGSMICSWREGIAFIISQVSCALQAFSAFLAKRSRTSSCKSHCFQKTHLRNTCYSCQYCWILKLANGTLMPHQVALDSHGNDDQTAYNWSLQGIRKEFEIETSIWRGKER